MRRDRILVLQPPSPPYLNVMRDYAGGYGIASRTTRACWGHERGIVPNVSMLYSTSILGQAGYEVLAIDGQAEQLGLTQVVNRAEELSPRLIISVLSLPSIEGDLSLLDAVHRVLPDVDIVCIGTVCKRLYEDVLAHESVRVAIRGDAEVVLPSLVPVLLDGGDLSKVPGIASREPTSQSTSLNPPSGQRVPCIVTEDAEPLSDLNSLPTPMYDLLPMDRYWHGNFGRDIRCMMILDSRGCSFPCGDYCPYPFGFGRKALYLDPVRVVDEMQMLNERFGMEAFVFRGQNFTVRRSHASEICHEILRRGMQVKWLCETRLDSVDRSLLELMKSAGCTRVHYGLESGDPDLFNKVGKPGKKLEDFGRAVLMTKEVGLFVRVNVVIGMPGECWRTVNRTARTIREWRPDAVMAAIMTPYPGTATYDHAKERGLLLTEDWSDYTGFDPVVRSERLSAQDLIRAKQVVMDAQWKDAFCKRAARRIKRSTQAAVNRLHGTLLRNHGHA